MQQTYILIIAIFKNIFLFFLLLLSNAFIICYEYFKHYSYSCRPKSVSREMNKKQRQRPITVVIAVVVVVVVGITVAVSFRNQTVKRSSLKPKPMSMLVNITLECSTFEKQTIPLFGFSDIFIVSCYDSVGQEKVLYKMYKC